MSVEVPEVTFTIGAEGVDTESIVSQIRERVAEKRKLGQYSDSRIARAERHNLNHLKDEESFLAFYMECLRDAVFIDINDFEIQERGGAIGKPLLLIKKVLWNLLKFYTYRLWSQQNQVNSLLQSAVESVDDHYRQKIKDLEARIEALESSSKS